jgi:hypothetical protein
MENNINIEDIFKGILTGFFASYLIILGMRPAAIYPDNILDIIDNPWIFLILFIINYYILYWDITVALLLFLTLIALILDIIIFTDGDFIKDNMGIENMSESSGASGAKEGASGAAKDAKTATKATDKSYKDINDIILEKLKIYESRQKSSNAFL